MVVEVVMVVAGAVVVVEVGVEVGVAEVGAVLVVVEVGMDTVDGAAVVILVGEVAGAATMLKKQVPTQIMKSSSKLKRQKHIYKFQVTMYT